MKKVSTFVGIAAIAMLVIGSFQFISAQKISFTPSNHIIKTWDTETTEFYVGIKNLTNGQLDLSWKFISSDMHTDWTYTICDNINCYPAFQENARFKMIEKGQSAFFTFDIFSPEGPKSNATVRLGVYETSNPSMIDTVSFSVQTTSSVEEPASYTAGITPNPATDILTISAEAALNSLQVFSAVGMKIMEMSNTNNTEVTLNIHELPAGVYYIKARDIYGKTVATKFQKF
ncbi:MAG: T9SS type A sorting domain-containing protein [Ignavibacteriae bacterium]|nr:T9SS type A sorting domain-containing protein [Ignavibacteriota bacterium]